MYDSPLSSLCPCRSAVVPALVDVPRCGSSVCDSVSENLSAMTVVVSYKLFLACSLLPFRSGFVIFGLEYEQHRR